MRKILIDTFHFKVWQFKLFEDDKLLDSVTFKADDFDEAIENSEVKDDNGMPYIKLFNDYDYYFAFFNDIVIFEKKDDLKLAVEFEFTNKALLSFYLDFFNNEYEGSQFSYNEKLYEIDDYFDIENNKVVIKDDILDIEFDIEKNIVINRSYKLDNDNKLFVPFPRAFMHCLGHFYDIYKPELFSARRLLKPGEYIDAILSAVSSMENSFLHNVENKIDTSSENLTTLIKNQEIDLSPVENKIDKLPQAIQDFFTLNITDLSLNGSNGAKFVDGEKVVVDGYSGIWEVKGSFQVLVDENNLTISYLLEKDNKKMIVPSAFVNNQGA